MQQAAPLTMPIPGHIDPVPVPRKVTPRADGRVDLLGLSKEQIRASLADAGMEPKQAKLRGKQLWHWIYNRGATDFTAMTDIAKRSEEHTSELQSLMRISYAVFCLKKKKRHKKSPQTSMKKQ